MIMFRALVFILRKVIKSKRKKNTVNETGKKKRKKKKEYPAFPEEQTHKKSQIKLEEKRHVQNDALMSHKLGNQYVLLRERENRFCLIRCHFSFFNSLGAEKC